jgi:glutamate-1-semialdehyde 2,1-aminomutase
MIGLFFQAGPVTDFASASRSDTHAFSVFFHEMLNRGVYLPPSQFEAWFVSAAHSDEQINATIAAAAAAFAQVAH